MSENVNFYQGSKENYNPSEMQGGLYFSKDSKEILLNGESYGNATPADEEDITAKQCGMAHSGLIQMVQMQTVQDGHLSNNNYIIWQQLMNNLFK